MSNEPGLQGADPPLGDKPFKAMKPREKLRFACKALIFFVSGGFIFPTLWID